MDVEQFIECVKNHPILYDRRCGDYNNIQKKNKNWAIVARQMGQSVQSVRVRWKGLKDGYTKYKKQLIEDPGSTSGYGHNWVWAPYLTFLDEIPNRRKRKVFSTLPDESSSDSLRSDQYQSQQNTLESVSSKSVIKIEEEQYYMESSESLQSENTQECMPPGIPSSQLRRSPEPLLMDSATPNRSPNYEKIQHLIQSMDSKTLDPTDLLFKSYSETFKKFSVRTQASLKVELAKLFANAEISELTGSASTVREELQSKNDDCSTNVHSRHS